MTLTFRTLQGGAEDQAQRIVEVDDPGMTISQLKRKCFEKEVVTQNRKVRLIHMGQMLDDMKKVSECGFSGREASLHAVISQAPTGEVSATRGDTGNSGAGNSPKMDSQVWISLAYLLFFIVTGMILQMEMRKIYPFGRIMSSQFLFLSCSVWVYILLCHALPAWSRALFGGGAAEA